jgi:hypothetical protein
MLISADLDDLAALRGYVDMGSTRSSCTTWGAGGPEFFGEEELLPRLRLP